MSSFSLEKWPLDIATDRGDVVCAELASCRFAGLGRAILTVSVWTSDGREERGLAFYERVVWRRGLKS